MGPELGCFSPVGALMFAQGLEMPRLGCSYLHPSFSGIDLALLPLGDPGLEFYHWFWLIKIWLH